MKATFKARCHLCETHQTGCAIVAVRGTNCYGDREVRVMTLCPDCRRACRNLYRVHPMHKPEADRARDT